MKRKLSCRIIKSIDKITEDGCFGLKSTLLFCSKQISTGFLIFWTQSKIFTVAILLYLKCRFIWPAWSLLIKIQRHLSKQEWKETYSGLIRAPPQVPETAATLGRRAIWTKTSHGHSFGLLISPPAICTPNSLRSSPFFIPQTKQ